MPCAETLRTAEACPASGRHLRIEGMNNAENRKHQLELMPGVDGHRTLWLGYTGSWQRVGRIDNNHTETGEYAPGYMIADADCPAVARHLPKERGFKRYLEAIKALVAAVRRAQKAGELPGEPPADKVDTTDDVNKNTLQVLKKDWGIA